MVDRANQTENSSSIVKGMAWMLVTTVLFVGVTGIVRHLGSDMSAPQAAFIRYAFGILLMIPFLLRIKVRQLITPRMGYHAMRGLVHGIGVMLWFFAMARIPIAEVTALGYTTPIFVTIGAAIFLGERFRIRRLIAVLLGLLGTLVIVRPGFATVELGTLAQVAAAPLFAISMLVSKKLTETEESTTIVALMAVFVTLTLLPFALASWRTPTLEELAWLFATASLATAGHYALTKAYQAAEITITQPISFLQLVWAALLGYYVFAETPDIWTTVGALIIVASATYIAHREAQLSRRTTS
ncbi:MAG: EamA family transporter [Alphaproteobacteria bacterium]|nr:EamA family transporter [Alphaproteobacteria bacterium]